MKYRDILIGLLVAIAWGSNFSAVKISLLELPAILALSLRCFITALLTLPFLTKPSIGFLKIYGASLIFGVFLCWFDVLWYEVRSKYFFCHLIDAT